MEFIEQLRAFLGPTVEDADLYAAARSAVAADVRALKVAIAERVWRARQRSAAGDQTGAASQLAAARQLQREYDAAMAEYCTLQRSGTQPSTNAA